MMKRFLRALAFTLAFLAAVSFWSISTAAAAGSIDFSSMGWCNPLKAMYPTGVGQFDNQDYLRKYGVRHAGYDIIDKSGMSQAVYAIDDGTVTSITRNNSTQNVSKIVIKHKTAGGVAFKAVYGHTYAVAALEVGANVSKGALIGNTKKYNVYHLHLGINLNDSFSKWGTTAANVDPTSVGWRDPTVWLLQNAASGHTVPGSGTPVLVTKITLSTKSATIFAGSSLTLSASVSPSNAGNKAVNWKSSNTSVASVSSDGVVTAKKKGAATITATAADGSKKKATCTITVVVPVSKISVPAMVFVKQKSTYKISMTISPSNATNKNVKWASANTKTATVSSSGKVTAKAVGKAIITATAKDGSKVQGSTTIYVYSSKYPVNGTVYNATALRVRTDTNLNATVIGHLSNGSIKVYGPAINGFYPIRGTDQNTNKTIYGFASVDYIDVGSSQLH